jgi:(p)ppGpp synthase/HD superfamily hydrolase
VSLVLTDKFERAFQYASIVHAGQRRKRSEIPFMAHLLGVASIAFEYGADEDEAIAALLHDSVEDAGGEERLQDIRTRFGDIVAVIVDGCTDSKTSPKPPWRTRKAAYIARVPHAPPAVKLVSAADKLYNVRSIIKDLRQFGNTAWDRFKGGKEGTLWYYRCLIQAYKTTGVTPLIEELDLTFAQLEDLVKKLDAESVPSATAAPPSEKS